jgi:hypothetical protein
LDQRDRHVLSALLAGSAALTTALPARAADAGKPALVLATSVEVSPGAYAAPAASGDRRANKLAAELDETVREGVEDLGLTPLPPPPATTPVTDEALVATPPASWVFAPRLEFDGEKVRVRVVAVPPGSRVELAREEEFTNTTLETLDVRTVVMLRDLFETGGQTGRTAAAVATSRPSLEEPAAPPSSGRSVLALNAAVLGGYVGFTIQKASGSADARLVYPLVALGAGLGIGASLLVADEWNITSGDAWYLAAGMWWMGASGFLLADAYGAKPDDRYLYGLAGAGVGITLGAAAIAMHPVSEGDAVLAHSGGAFGGLLGAMTDAAIQGETSGSLKRGIGWGTGVGVLVGGALATQVDISPSRALLIDLSASLGALGGAAIASPLLLVNDSSPDRTRVWLGSAALGTVAGGVIGWYITAPAAKGSSSPPTAATFLPYASPAPSGKGMTLGLTGAF